MMIESSIPTAPVKAKIINKTKATSTNYCTSIEESSLNTSSSSTDNLNNPTSSDDSSGDEDLLFCKKNSLNNLKDLYKTLNDIDDTLHKEIITDHFYHDNYSLTEEKQQQQQQNVKAQQQLAKPSILIVNNRNIDFPEWNDGLGEWAPTHAYPSFKNYIQNYNKKKTKRNEFVEFDEELGLFLPLFKHKQSAQPVGNVAAPQKPASSNQTQHLQQSNSLNTLNNTVASNKLIRELHKLVSSQQQNALFQESTRVRSNSASSKKCLQVKPANLPFSLLQENSNNNNNNTHNNVYSQLQLRSDELDRVKSLNQNQNFRLDYRYLGGGVGGGNKNLAQEHLNHINQVQNSINFSQDELAAYDLVESDLLTEKEILNNMLYAHKSESDSNLRANYNSLNTMSSRLLKVSPLNVNNNNNNSNNNPQNQSEKKTNFYIENTNPDNYETQEFIANPFYSNPSGREKNRNGVYRNHKVNYYAPSSSSMAILKPLMVNTSSATQQQMQSSPLISQKLIDNQSTTNQSTNPSFDITLTNTATTLPPIVSGKRINLPLGPHRYAQYHRPNKAHLYKIAGLEN